MDRRYADQAFENFWAAYPRKVGKGAARKVWDRLRPDEALVNKIAAALDWQREQEQWRDPQFIPHPRTWLFQERWDDEPTLPATRAPQMPKNLTGIQEWMSKKIAGV